MSENYYIKGGIVITALPVLSPRWILRFSGDKLSPPKGNNAKEAEDAGILMWFIVKETTLPGQKLAPHHHDDQQQK